MSDASHVVVADNRGDGSRVIGSARQRRNQDGIDEFVGGSIAVHVDVVDEHLRQDVEHSFARHREIPPSTMSSAQFTRVGAAAGRPAEYGSALVREGAECANLGSKGFRQGSRRKGVGSGKPSDRSDARAPRDLGLIAQVGKVHEHRLSIGGVCSKRETLTYSWHAALE
jgi:hypothetical protein